MYLALYPKWWKPEITIFKKLCETSININFLERMEKLRKKIFYNLKVNNINKN